MFTYLLESPPNLRLFDNWAGFGGASCRNCTQPVSLGHLFEPLTAKVIIFRLPLYDLGNTFQLQTAELGDILPVQGINLRGVIGRSSG